MRPLRAFLLGLAAGSALALGAALAVAALAGVDDLRVALGPLVFLELLRGPAASETTFGPGLAAAALALGIVNAALAAMLERRGR